MKLAHKIVFYSVFLLIIIVFYLAVRDPPLINQFAVYPIEFCLVLFNILFYLFARKSEKKKFTWKPLRIHQPKFWRQFILLLGLSNCVFNGTLLEWHWLFCFTF